LFLVTQSTLANTVMIQNDTITQNQSGIADVILTVNNWVQEYKIASQNTIKVTTPSQFDQVRFIVNYYLDNNTLKTVHCDDWIYFNNKTNPILHIVSNSNPVDETSLISCEIQ